MWKIKIWLKANTFLFKDGKCCETYFSSLFVLVQTPHHTPRILWLNVRMFYLWISHIFPLLRLALKLTGIQSLGIVPRQISEIFWIVWSPLILSYPPVLLIDKCKKSQTIKLCCLRSMRIIPFIGTTETVCRNIEKMNDVKDIEHLFCL